jgi:acetolactate synthase small subunit
MEIAENEKQEFNITVYTENQIGLLNRIAIIFTRRKINIDSLKHLAIRDREHTPFQHRDYRI